MSLILDALNRSRQDVGEVPGLESQHQVIGDSRPGGNRWWALALAVALAVIAWLVFERGDDSSAPVAAPELPVTPPQEAVVRPVVEVPATPVTAVPVPTQKTPAKQAPKAEVAALYAKPSARAVAAVPSIPATRPNQVEKPAQQPAVAKQPASEQPVDIEAMMRQAQDDLENAQLEEHPAPFISSLSQQTKNRIPTIFYERHDYSGTSGQSAVVLSGKTLKRGGRTSSGVRVDEILPDSVVLTHEGTQFRLRALNSWVNL